MTCIKYIIMEKKTKIAFVSAFLQGDKWAYEENLVTF